MITIHIYHTEWPDNCHTTMLAVEEGLPIATAMLRYDKSRKERAYLWNLHVDPMRRREGLAKRMIEHAESDAQQHGCKELTLDWSPLEAEGWTFDWYKRIGFTLYESKWS